MDHTIRPYDKARDFEAVFRIWREVGWIDDESKKPALHAFLDSSNAAVAEMDGDAECMVLWTPGSIRYQRTDLALCGVTAVTTSHVGRKQGFASRMSLRALQQGAARGCAMAMLGMFEQGFYDRLGFGTWTHDIRTNFDPGALAVDHVPYRTPVRLTADDYEDVHAALSRRLRTHGGVTLDPPLMVHGEMLTTENPFTLGYRDEDGELTHFVFGGLAGEHGPFTIDAYAYQTPEQLLELLRLLSELGDQIRTVRMDEPAHAQLQVLLRAPMRERDRTGSAGTHTTGAEAVAWRQFRILDVAACVAARQWQGAPVRFNLRLDDPVERMIDEATDGAAGDGDDASPAGDDVWRGICGDYTITVGAASAAVAGHEDGLPLLEAGVGAFTRLWFGVRQASALAVSDELTGPPELLEALDEALLLPPLVAGLNF